MDPVRGLEREGEKGYQTREEDGLSWARTWVSAGFEWAALAFWMFRRASIPETFEAGSSGALDDAEGDALSFVAFDGS